MPHCFYDIYQAMYILNDPYISTECAQKWFGTKTVVRMFWYKVICMPNVYPINALSRVL